MGKHAVRPQTPGVMQTGQPDPEGVAKKIVDVTLAPAGSQGALYPKG